MTADALKNMTAEALDMLTNRLGKGDSYQLTALLNAMAGWRCHPLYRRAHDDRETARG